MNEKTTLDALQTAIHELSERAKTLKHTFASIKAPDSLAAVTMAHDMATLGQEFINAAVLLKQAARNAADEQVKARPAYQASTKNAAQAARELRQRGAYSVAP